MILLIRHPLIVWLSLILLVGQVGCAHGPPTNAFRPSDEVREHLGTIGVVPVRFDPEGPGKVSYYEGYGTSQGGSGFFTPGGGGGGFGGIGPYAGGAFLLLMGAILVVGGTIVLVRALTEEDDNVPSGLTQEWDTPDIDIKTLKQNELARLLIHKGLSDRIIEMAENQTSHQFVALTEEGPTEPDEEVDYQSLKDEGIDTILEIGIPILGFVDVSHPCDIPEKMLIVTALARLIRVADGEEIFARTWEYTGVSHTADEWAVDNGQPLHDELEGGLQTLAEWIVGELFLS